MASDNPTPPEGAKPFEAGSTDSDNDDSDVIDLSPGETLQGHVTDVFSGEHDDGKPWHLLTILDEDRGLVKWFAKDEAKTACTQERLEAGDEIWVGMQTDQKEFETDDGETKEYNPVELHFL